MNIILDAHLDIAYHALSHGRDFRKASWQKRAQEGKFPGHPYDQIGVATVGLPDLLMSRVGVIFGTLWVSPPSEPYDPALTYYSPQEAYQKALRQLDYYHRLADEDKRIRLITHQKHLDEVLESWKDGREIHEHLIGIAVLMEGADPILEPAQVEEWYERGLRIVGPAWHATRYSAGTGAPGRLTRLGYELLEVMSDLNMILDGSHLAEQAFFDALGHYPGPVIASHSNPRRFMNGDRNLSDDMIRVLIEHNGVMGIVPYNPFLKNGWKSGRDPKNEVSIHTVLEAIDHVCQVAGSADYVGIGTDWDGGFGWESIPAPFDSHTDLWLLRRLLLEQYSEADTQKILCGNFLRVLREGLPT